MHELSLCEAIADIVLEAAGGRAVRRVDVCVGRLRQVVPETLAFCWEAWCAGGPLAQAELVLDDVPVLLECRDCGVRTEVGEDLLMACAACGSVAVRAVAGDEFQVTSIDVVPTSASGAEPRGVEPRERAPHLTDDGRSDAGDHGAGRAARGG